MTKITQPHEKETGINFLRAVSSFGGFVLLSRFTGYVRDWLVSSLIGANAISDAFVLAIKLPAFFRRLSAEGAFHVSFLPVFSKTLGASKEITRETQAFCNTIFTLLTIILCVGIALVEWKFEWIISVCFENIARNPESFYWVNHLGRIVFPYIIFISLASFFGSILNAFGRFSLWAAAHAIGNAVVVAYVLCLKPWNQDYGTLFAWGVLVSGMVQCGVMAWAFWRRGFRVSFCWPKFTPWVREFFRKFGPGAAGVGVLQMNLLVGMYLATRLPTGGLSYLHYADRLNQLPLSIIGVSVSSVLLPILVRQLQTKNMGLVNKTQNHVLRLVMAIILPITILLISLAFPLSYLLFGHGRLTPDQVGEVAKTLMALGIGIPAYINTKILTVRFSAHGNTRLPLIASSIGVGIDIVLSLLLIPFLHHVGIALAIGISAWSSTLCLLLALRRQYGWRMLPFIWRFMVRLLGICLATAGILGILQGILPSFHTLSLGVQFLGVTGLFLGGGTLIFGLALKGKVISMKHLRFIQKTFLKRASSEPNPKPGESL